MASQENEEPARRGTPIYGQLLWSTLEHSDRGAFAEIEPEPGDVALPGVGLLKSPWLQIDYPAGMDVIT
ncbi:MAG: hypothetical protein QF785_08350 [Phycisphaeraceae bacterium]|jgi:hypothetical protein|nr:hypothetical protein [Phycisphaeraceae bacterium]